MHNKFFVGARVFVKKNIMSNDGDYGRIIEIDDEPINGKPCKTILYKVECDDGKKFLCGADLLVATQGTDGLISRKELLDMLDKDPREAFTKHQVWTLIVYGLREVIPVYEPNRAEWRINSDGYYPYCSNCNKEPEGGKMTDFCPNCGADMRNVSTTTSKDCDSTEISYLDGGYFSK